MFLLRDPAPAGAKARLVEEQVVEQDLDPVARQPDLPDGHQAAHRRTVEGRADDGEGDRLRLAPTAQ